MNRFIQSSCIRNRNKLLLHILNKYFGIFLLLFAVPWSSKDSNCSNFFYVPFMLSKSWNTSRCILEGCRSLTLFRISLVLLYCGFFSFIFLGYNICQFCFMGLFVYRKWKKKWLCQETSVSFYMTVKNGHSWLAYNGDSGSDADIS